MKEKKNYSFSDDSNLDKEKGESSQNQDDIGADDGDLSLDDYDPDPEEYYNIINMMEK